MSRWFPDSLKVRVCAEALEFQLVSANKARDWGRALMRDEAGAITALTVCSALDAELAELATLQLKIEVMIDSPWLRFCLIPWNDDFTSARDRASFVQHRFFETYGEMARHWTTQSSLPAYGNQALGAAIDSELLAGLSRSAERSKRRLAAVRPYLTERIEQARQGIKDDTFWFVLSDPNHYTLLLLHSGSPAAIQVAGRREASLDTLLERAWRSFGLEQERCPVYVDFGRSAASELGESRLGWNIEQLPSVLPVHRVGQQRALSKLAL